jgi:Prealbumin-like fold domain
MTEVRRRFIQVRAGAEFTLYKDNPPIGGSRAPEDTVTSLKCTTTADGTCTIDNVFQGEYCVVETVVPPGHDGMADQHVTVLASQTVTVGRWSSRASAARLR